MSEHNLQLCRFCQTDNKLAYYCDSCGSSFCSDCVYEEKLETFVCQECNSRNIELNFSEQKVDSNQNSGKDKSNVNNSLPYKKCRACGSQNIIKVIQQIKSCPKCRSHNVINIYEKKEELEQQFLELIKISREYLKPFNEVINQLYLVREQVRKAREPPIRCHHFPEMESDMLSLFKLFYYIEENLLEKLNIHFQHISLNKEHFFDIHTQPNTNIRIIEGILENLRKSADSISDYIVKNTSVFKESLVIIEKNLKFIEKITKLFLAHREYLNLAENEKPIYAIRTKLANGIDSQDRVKKNRGILFITNLDLSFIQEFGFLKKKKQLSFKAPVEEIRRIKEKGKLFKKLYLEFEYGKYELSIPSKIISQVIEYILLARCFEETNIFNYDTATRLLELELDLSRLKNFIEENINTLYSLKAIHNREQQDKIRKQLSQINKPNDTSNYNQLQASYQSPPVNPSEIHPPNNLNYPQSIQNFSQPLNQYYPLHSPNYGQQISNQYQSNPIFYRQNPHTPNRIQNYKSEDFYNPIRDDPSISPNLQEKVSMRRELNKAQNYSGQGKSKIDAIINELMKLKMALEVSQTHETENRDFSRSNHRRLFHDYNRNHLSGYFDQDAEEYGKSSFNSSSNYSKKVSVLYQKAQDLNKERICLTETLRELDTKFNEGMVSGVEYFRNFKELKKEIVSIDEKVDRLEKEIKETISFNTLRNNATRNGYFS